MDLDDLRTFDHIVREGSFSRAAWVQGVAQATVSARIQGLEREVGGALFTRGRKVALTQRGVSFLPYVRRALGVLQDGLDAARLASTGERGRLAVGALRSLSGAFLAPAVAQAYRQHPGVEIVVREGRHAEIVDALADGVVELGVICWPPADGHHPDLTPVLHLVEEVRPTLHPQHPLAAGETITVPDLLTDAQPLLLLRWWQVTPPELLTLAAQARDVADVPTDTGRHLLLDGLGVGFYPALVIQPELDTGRLVQRALDGRPPLTRRTALVHLSRRTLSAPATRFVDVLTAQAGTLRLRADVV
ncbi:DNA-binding transcriptional LysR family regulator [Deinococcus metalli]|uniref:DNA-binding transcriptional LysR family regulator n=1 Tax=Deinococcus metalli TaxID=1141878 RepID=A0A7W8KDV7_9DEIO|nr:LysR family transcriptional regulator [Deinococcus metalli]MBB5375248.1 DNA-binding transcriptional LysR family regulator [Deinococcus metalli]GHF30669.1 hypothetical protein GCM10017781_03490 [Deinococcus metalli]